MAPPIELNIAIELKMLPVTLLAVVAIAENHSCLCSKDTINNGGGIWQLQALCFSNEQFLSSLSTDKPYVLTTSFVIKPRMVTQLLTSFVIMFF